MLSGRYAPEKVQSPILCTLPSAFLSPAEEEYEKMGKEKREKSEKVLGARCNCGYSNTVACWLRHLYMLCTSHGPRFSPWIALQVLTLIDR